VRDISSDVRGKAITLAAGVLVIYGLINIIVGVLITVLSGFGFYALLVTWPYLIIGGLYMALGYGLLDRHEWAYYGTLILVPIALALYMWSLFLSFAISDVLGGIFVTIHILVHGAILILIGLSRKEFTWKPVLRSRPRAELHDERTEALKCENCHSENIAVFPDGSGKCNDCKHVFTEIWSSGT
jgi:hypothetical protein